MKALLGLLVGLGLCLVLTVFAGENPAEIANILFNSNFGSFDDLAFTLFYMTSLMFTGLAVCVAFQAGLFNIGAEGQLTIATLVTTWLALKISPMLSDHSFFTTVFCLFIGLLSAALWGFIPAYFKVKRGSHEVIMTMMMNFIAAGFATEFVLRHQSTESQNPETQMISEFLSWKSFDPLHQIAPNSALNMSFILALFLCFLTGYLLYNSRWGFGLRLTGLNPTTAKLSGIRIDQVKMQSLALGGLFAGFVAANEIFGSQLKYRLGFSPDYGFIGIAVALLARNNPYFIPASAFLFASLQKGASDLDLETEYITRDYARVMQAILILSVISFSLIQFDKISLWLKKKIKG